MQLNHRALLIAITCAVSAMVEAQVLTCANGRVGLPCSEVAIQYDEAGNITKIGSDNYRYDTLNRLKFADLHNGIALSENFTYDAFGNLTKVTYAGRPERTLATDELTNHLSTATYDDAGRALNDGLTTYAYDAGGMVTEASTSGGGRMLDVYGPGGERIGTMTAGSGSGSLNQYVAKWTVRGGGAKVAREFREDASAGTPSISWTRDYIFRDGVLLGELLPNTAQDERINHYHVDHLGTPRLITDEAGIEVSEHQYEPFGEELTPIVGQMESLKFTGHERDFLGGTNSENKQYVDYMHARYYGSVLGRFLSVDPVLGQSNAPQSWNRYFYVLDNPLRNTDPTGRSALEESTTYDSLLSFVRALGGSSSASATSSGRKTAKKQEVSKIDSDGGEKLDYLPEGDSSKWAAEQMHAGRYTILINAHGTVRTVNGMDPLKLANAIKKDSKTWSPRTVIILNSCDSGRGNHSIAQELSKIMQTTVIGNDQPNWTAGPLDLGTWGTLGANGGQKTGGWPDFNTPGHKVIFIDGERVGTLQ